MSRTLAIAAATVLIAAADATAQESVYQQRVAVAGQHARVLDATDSGQAGDPAVSSGSLGHAAEAPTRSKRSTARAIPFRSLEGPADTERSEADGARPLVTVASSLAIVLGLFAAVTFLYRRTATASGALLPGEAFAVLGKAPLGPRQNLTLVRVGQRVLVLAISAGGITRLSELDDPDEVARLTALCQSGGSRQTFHRTLHELGEETPANGFVQPSAPPPRRGLFASG